MKDLQNNYDIPEHLKSDLLERIKRRIKGYMTKCPRTSGRTHYMRYLKGEKLTHKEAMLAKCAECWNGYEDGKEVCTDPLCPLYQFMPYVDRKTKEMVRNLMSEAENE